MTRIIDPALTVRDPSVTDNYRIPNSGGTEGSPIHGVFIPSDLKRYIERADKLSSVGSTSGDVVFDLGMSGANAFILTLTEDINTDGVSFANVPAGKVEVFIQVVQSGGPWDLLLAAFPSGWTFTQTWTNANQDATPTVIYGVTLDAGTVWRGEHGGTISHADLADVGTNTHAQIDTHIADTANPHGVTKAQVGLTNVTDNPQLTRDADDFDSFTEKATPVSADLLLVEDSEAAGVKKKVQVGNLPAGGGGISNVVEDTTPQLGGDLDMNGNNLIAAGPVDISPTEMSYLNGVTGDLQGQIDGKSGTGHNHSGVYEPADALLTAIGALSMVADRYIYGTGTDTVALGTLTSFVRTIFDDVDAAAVRGTISAQELDATLTALAGLTTAANQMMYSTGVDTFSMTSLTAAARVLLGLTTGTNSVNLTLGTANTPSNLSMAASTFLMRRATGDIVAGTYAQVKTDLIITPNTARSTNYALTAADSVNSSTGIGAINIFSGTTNNFAVNTGLKTYVASEPLQFIVLNIGSGNATKTGTATVTAATGFTSVVLAGGMALLVQTADNTYTISGALVAA